MEKKSKNGSHRYDINRSRSTHGHKYRKYKTCIIIIMLICTKQHLSNIWGSIHEKCKQHGGWVEKSVAYKKKRVIQYLEYKLMNRIYQPNGVLKNI